MGKQEYAGIVEIITKRKGWRSELTRSIPGSRMTLLEVFPTVDQELTFSNQLVEGVPLDTLEEFLSSNRKVHEYMIFRISEKGFMVGVWDKHRYLTPQFISVGAYPLFFPSIEGNVAKWILVVSNPSDIFPILFESDEVVSIRRLPIKFAETPKVIKKEFEKRYLSVAPPELSETQKTILTLALRSGFYDYPRKVSLKELSDFLRMPSSTVSYNLRKAEKRILQWYMALKR